jgi:hypothetical protein
MVPVHSPLVNFGTVGVQTLVRAMAQARVHGPGLVGAVEHFIETLVDHKRQALAAVLGVAAQRWPPPFNVGGVGGLEALGHGHLVGGLIEFAPFLITADVQRKRYLGRKFAALFQHRIDGVNVQLGVRRANFELVNNIEHFVHHKLHVTQGGGVAGHGGVSVDEFR